LIETGLGGRFDATNVFGTPALTIISPISMDHMSWLGDSIEKIAFEKAGILKPGVRAIIGPQEESAHSVIAARGRELASPLVTHGNDWTFSKNSEGFVLEDGKNSQDLPPPSLAGDHQIINAATAVVAACRLNELNIPIDAIRKGIQTAFWPGRLQKLKGALANRLPDGWSLWLDGGHNVAAAEGLAAASAKWDDQPLHLVFGFLNNRDPTAFLTPLAKQVSTLQAIQIPDEEASLTAEDAARAALEAGVPAQAAKNFVEAIDLIVSDSATPGRILICGSLYLAGAVLAYEEAPPEDGAL
tara:strand:- start:26296 stop:27195 length:900 start_codon:yes stop_codon:yes gene_type:complete